MIWQIMTFLGLVVARGSGQIMTAIRYLVATTRRHVLPVFAAKKIDQNPCTHLVLFHISSDRSLPAPIASDLSRQNARCNALACSYVVHY